MLAANLFAFSRRAALLGGLLISVCLATAPRMAAAQKVESHSSYETFHSLPMSFLSQLYPRAFIRSSAQLGPIFKRCSPLIPIDANYESLLATYQITVETEGVLSYQEVQALYEQGLSSGTNLAAALPGDNCEGFLESFMRHDAETSELLKVSQASFLQINRSPNSRASASAVRNSIALITTAQACDLDADTVAPYKALALLQAKFLAEEKLATVRDITRWQEDGIALGNSQYGPMGLSACKEIAATLAAENGRVLSYLKYNQDPQ